MKNNFAWSGSRIVAARDAVGMKRKELAEKINVAYTQLSDWENSDSPPKLENLVKIAEATKCDIAWLITGEEQERVPLNDEKRALIDAYARADENKKRIVRLTLEIDETKGDKYNLALTHLQRPKANNRNIAPLKEKLPELGFRIQDARFEANKMSLADLARKLEVSPSQISLWECGRKIPSIEAMLKIADATGADLAWLITGVHQAFLSESPEALALFESYRRVGELSEPLKKKPKAKL